MSTVYLREIARSDLDQINRWRSRRDVVSQLGTAFRYVGREVDERWYDQYLASRSTNVRLAICIDDELVIGASYLIDIDWVHRNAEFAIWIGESDAQGRGIGEQATSLTLAHAFDDLNLHRVYLSVLSSNSRATALYRKLGFVQEGVRREALYKNGVYHDVVLMALLRSEYAAVSSAP